MSKRSERPYVITSTSVVASDGRSSNALTRDAVRLEVAMRLIAKGRLSVKQAWDISDEFIIEMDARLPELPKQNNGG